MRLRSVRLVHSCLPALILLAAVALTAQTPATPPPQPAPYTLRTESRIVLLDVNVTDRNGNPIHNLPRSAFHITDDKQPETIASFDEHALTGASTLVATTAHPRGTFSNDFLLHAPPVLNILLLDLSNLQTEDQIVLRIQLTRLIDILPGDQPLAVYLRTTGACVLLQDFTVDRALLHAAVNRALPRLFVRNPYHDDLYTLHQITSTLQQLPGRKNILWFSGGAPLHFFTAGALEGNPVLFRDNAAVRQVYDELEAARIAVYPIDARGITLEGGLGEAAQHSTMDEVAAATGGHAVYSNNALAEAAGRALETDRSFYTLTYTPQNFRPDHKWHTVRVHLDDPNLRLSYRAGYFSDKALPANSPELKPSSPRLLADGSLAQDPASEQQKPPIVFNARVLPLADPASHSAGPDTLLTAAVNIHRGSIPYSIHYDVPASSFAIESIKGKPCFVLGVAAIAFSSDGTAIARTAQKVTLSISPDTLPLAPRTSVPLTQQLALGKGDLSLVLAVWDTVSGRIGTLQIPLHVTAPPKP